MCLIYLLSGLVSNPLSIRKLIFAFELLLATLYVSLAISITLLYVADCILNSSVFPFAQLIPISQSSEVGR